MPVGERTKRGTMPRKLSAHKGIENLLCLLKYILFLQADGEPIGSPYVFVVDVILPLRAEKRLPKGIAPDSR